MTDPIALALFLALTVGVAIFIRTLPPSGPTRRHGRLP